jgi:hypothetical protein
MVTPQGSGAMDATVLKQAQNEVFRSILRLVMSDHDSSLQVNAVAPDTVEISGTDGRSVRIQFDPATGLPLKEIYVEGAMPAEESFSDWRDAGGLKVPFKLDVQQDGKKLAEVTVIDYKFNTGLKAEELSKKP